mmetsp:Transcript_16923/g.19219  ORF Transcript_16923/g.19219 Transcript_16923/m.19219 type:complete len:406 (-) Transcript_16923:705-1922(-)
MGYKQEPALQVDVVSATFTESKADTEMEISVEINPDEGYHVEEQEGQSGKRAAVSDSKLKELWNGTLTFGTKVQCCNSCVPVSAGSGTPGSAEPYVILFGMIIGLCIIEGVPVRVLSEKSETATLYISTAVLGAVSVGLFLITQWTDPGVMPREDIGKEGAKVLSKARAGFRPPSVQNFLDSGQVIKMDYCSTCGIFTPPQSKHCPYCKNCIQRYDHHCPWVGNCIGRRNYRYFFSFLIVSFLLLVYVFLVCCVAIVSVIADGEAFSTRNATSEEGNIDGVNADIIVTIVSLLLIFFILCPSIQMVLFHTSIAMTNQTTNDYIYNRVPESVGPGAVMKIFFSTLPKSYIPSWVRAVKAQQQMLDKGNIDNLERVDPEYVYSLARVSQPAEMVSFTAFDPDSVFDS